MREVSHHNAFPGAFKGLSPAAYASQGIGQAKLHRSIAQWMPHKRSLAAHQLVAHLLLRELVGEEQLAGTNLAEANQHAVSAAPYNYNFPVAAPVTNLAVACMCSVWGTHTAASCTTPHTHAHAHEKRHAHMHARTHTTHAHTRRASTRHT